MNVFVIYDTKYGNTGQLAETIAKALEESATVKLLSVDKAYAARLDEAALLVFGAPTQGHGMSESMRAYLTHLPPTALLGMSAAVFDTRFHGFRLFTGSAAHSIRKVLHDKGAALIVPPESFFVKGSPGLLEAGELERAARWARTLVAKVAPAAA